MTDCEAQKNTLRKALRGYLLLALAASLTTSISLRAFATEDDTLRPPTATPDEVKDGTQTGGKGSGMGRDYQKSTPGPGQGEPDYRGGNPVDGGSGGGTRKGNDSPGKGRDGAGVGVGYPGYRGQGGDDSPHHRQYGNPPQGPD